MNLTFCNFGPSPVLTLEHQDINSRTSSGFDEIERPVQGCHHELENADEEKGRLLEDGASEGRYRRCLRQGWTLEIISEAVALAGLLAMVGLLSAFEGRPITTWPYEKLTLNGAIAMLATVIKTGLVIPVSAAIGQRKWIRWSSRSKADTNKRIYDFETYDEASRGHLGCGRLLFVTPRNLACVGAVIILTSVFFSALTQNVLTTDIRPTKRNGTGHELGAQDLIAARQYITFLAERDGDDYDSSLANFDNLLNETVGPQSPIQAAHTIISAILSRSVVPDTAECSTGNCSWPQFNTLGICSQCINATDLLKKTCNSTICDYSLPGGNSFSLPKAKTQLSENAVTVYGIVNGSQKVFEDAEAQYGTRIQVPVWTFDYIGATYRRSLESYSANLYDLENLVNDFAEMAPIATECGFWFCVKTLKINVTRGRLVETELARQSEARRTKADGTVGNRDHYVFVEPTDSVEAAKSPLMVTESSRFWLEDFLHRTLTLERQTFPFPSLMERATNEDQAPALELNKAWIPIDMVQESMFYFSKELQEKMDNVARSLTKVMRQVDPMAPNRTSTVPGEAWIDTVYFQVRWAWLTLPAALVVLSAVLLVATIIRSSRSGVALHKNSAIAALGANLY